MQDIEYMRLAIAQAKQAREADEVPVGAVLVKDGRVVAAGHNQVETAGDATAHAELMVLKEGMRILGKRLTGCTLYVTLEPCAMCTGAMLNAKLSRLVFGAFEERTGCCGSVTDLTQGAFLHTIESIGGIAEEECVPLMRDYFEAKRKENSGE